MSFARTSSVAPIQVLSDQLRLLLRSADSPFQMSVMVVDVPPGGFVPPRTVHGYGNHRDEPVRFLAWTVGGPIDQFFVAMSQRVKQMPQDASAMAEITARFGVQMVGAPD